MELNKEYVELTKKWCLEEIEKVHYFMKRYGIGHEDIATVEVTVRPCYLHECAFSLDGVPKAEGCVAEAELKCEKDRVVHIKVSTPIMQYPMEEYTLLLPLHRKDIWGKSFSATDYDLFTFLLLGLYKGVLDGSEDA